MGKGSISLSWGHSVPQGSRRTSRIRPGGDQVELERLLDTDCSEMVQMREEGGQDSDLEGLKLPAQSGGRH